MSIKIFLLIALLSSQCFAAFNATTIWRTSQGGFGSDTNGIAFDPGVGSPGTDESCGASTLCTAGTYSAGTSVTITIVSTSLFTVTTVPAITSTTHGPGNFIYISGTTSGTCNTAAWYEIKTQSSGTGVLDRTPGSTGAVCTGTLGGPGLTIGNVLSIPPVAGNNVCVKADGTYSISSNLAFSTGGTVIVPIIYQGYTTTCGVNGAASDKGTPLVQATVALTGIFTTTANYNQFYNFILDSNSQTGTTRGVNVSSLGVALLFDNIITKNFATSGFSVLSGSSIVNISNSRATGGLSGCTAGFAFTGSLVTATSLLADSNNCHGISSAAFITCSFCIAANNIGASSDGIHDAAASGLTDSWINCMGYGNGANGYNGSSSSGNTSRFIRNSVFYGNTTEDINLTGGTLQQTIQLDYNAYATKSGFTAGPHDVTLSADPTVAGASLNFAPNTTSGGGLALKVVGFPGRLTTGGTGYLSIGPLQPNPSAGGGGQVGYPIGQ